MPPGHFQGGEQAEGMEMGEQPEARLVEVPRPLAPWNFQLLHYSQA